MDCLSKKKTFTFQITTTRSARCTMNSQARSGHLKMAALFVTFLVLLFTLNLINIKFYLTFRFDNSDSDYNKTRKWLVKSSYQCDSTLPFYSKNIITYLYTSYFN